MVDPVVAQPTPPKVPLIVQVVDGFNQPLSQVEVEVVNFRTELQGASNDVKKQTSAQGLANFGLVDPRIKFDIKVRKSKFGPPGTPFTPGENRVVRRPNLKGKPIVLPLTLNLAKLRIRVLTPAPSENPIPGAIIGIDGITGAPPLPQTDGNGNSQLFLLPPGTFRFHAQKNGFGPQPLGAAKFQKDQEVVGTRTLLDGDIATEVLHLTRFIAKLTVNVLSPSAPGALPGPEVPLNDADVGVDGVTGAFLKTKDGGKVAIDVPAGQDFHVRARKSGFSKPAAALSNLINLSFDETDVKAMAEDEQREVTLRLMEVGQVAPVITPQPALPASGAVIVLVKKPKTAPKRWKINVKADASFTGTGILKMDNPSGSVKIFKSATGTDEAPFSGAKQIVIPTAGMNGAGTDLFIEGAAFTAKLADLKLTLELTGDNSKVMLPPVSIKVTCVELTLDLAQSRSAVGAEPAVMSAADKINVGRFLHRQVNNKHGRALMIVREPKPAAFTDQLTLKPVVAAGAAAAVRLFDKEVPDATAALGNPHDFAFDPAKNRFFAEGVSPTSGARVSGYMLGVKGLDDDGDQVAITVVQFSNLQASVPTTKENTAQTVAALGANTTTPATSALTVGTAGANGFDEDFFAAAGSNTIVLMENSIKGGAVAPAHFVELSVTVSPDVPEVRSALKWKARRDTRPAPLGDDPGIATLAAPRVLPTVAANATDPRKATLMADSVGSFHVGVFIDGNRNGEWDFNDATTGARIDREPFMLMCFILVRAQGFDNSRSRAQDVNANFTRLGGGGAPTSAAGVQFGSGGFSVATAAAVQDATAVLVGGGRNGRLGLDRVFGHWIQGSTGFTSVHGYQQNLAPPAPPVNHPVTAFFSGQSTGHASPGGSPNTVTFFVAPPAGVATPAGAIVVASGAGTVAPLATPILDVTKFGNEGVGGNTCVGTDGVQGGAIPIITNPRPLGQDRRFQMIDSPGWGAVPSHPGGQPGQLTSFSFNMNFRADLCFWTNISSNPAATNDPACRLYVTVVTNQWSVAFNINFNLAAGGVGVASPRPWVTINPEVFAAGSGRLARAIDRGSEPVEVRFPIFTRSWSADASR